MHLHVRHVHRRQVFELGLGQVRALEANFAHAEEARLAQDTVTQVGVLNSAETRAFEARLRREEKGAVQQSCEREVAVRKIGAYGNMQTANRTIVVLSFRKWSRKKWLCCCQASATNTD